MSRRAVAPFHGHSKTEAAANTRLYGFLRASASQQFGVHNIIISYNTLTQRIQLLLSSVAYILVLHSVMRQPHPDRSVRPSFSNLSLKFICLHNTYNTYFKVSCSFGALNVYFF